MNKKSISTLAVGILGIGFLYFLASYALPRVMVNVTKARPEQNVDFKQSYVIGSKIIAKADGKEQCIVNVFVGDASGLPINGKKIVLSGQGVTIKADNDVTDALGKTVFKITSTTEGQYKVTASVEGAPMIQGLTLTFRN